jgi:poly-beta-hydroxybutyrate-responsive repressor
MNFMKGRMIYLVRDRECGCEQGMSEMSEGSCECPGIIKERFCQPCILLLLSNEPSYGYELIDTLDKLGSSADASSVYKTLRKMEQEGLVKSRWDTEGAGPAKRYYEITPEGEELLHAWAVTIRKHLETLEGFLKIYGGRFRVRT